MNNPRVSANSTKPDLESLAFHDRLQLHDAYEEQDEEFSFVCANPNDSPISADDAFFNGQIRPVYPLFDRSLLFVDGQDPETPDNPPLLRPPLRKLFVEKQSESDTELEGVVEGTYCEWSPTIAELGKKSNSTGFSKLWRFREFMTMRRSSSDGKDAFVFLSNPNPTTPKSPQNKLQPQPTSTSTSTSIGFQNLHLHLHFRSKAQPPQSPNSILCPRDTLHRLPFSAFVFASATRKRYSGKWQNPNLD
ncbi:hypothetical protein SDJN03_17890, partial [Cucurbita argyrosperma subsp. sororia]